MEIQPKLQLISKKIPVQNFHKFPICETCKAPIEDSTFRFLIIQDEKLRQKQLSYHFFFPCWDVELLCQKYPNLIIDKLRFSFPKKMKLNNNSMQDLQNNFDFWK